MTAPDHIANATSKNPCMRGPSTHELCLSWVTLLSGPIKPICNNSFDLLCKRLAVPLLNYAKNRALVHIAERQCDDLGANQPRLIGRDAAGFEYIGDPLPDHEHARLIEDASKTRKTPALRNNQAIERQRIRLDQR